MMIHSDLYAPCPTVARTERLSSFTNSKPDGNAYHPSALNYVPAYLLNLDYQCGYKPLNSEAHCQILPFSNQKSVISQTDMPLSVHVEMAVRQYLSALEGEDASDLYELILSQIEKPLLTVVLEFVKGNQSKCAQILGLNRGTLRKKLKTYQLMK